MDPQTKPPTIYDVAARAGVSHQTVTRLLRGYEGIRPATRARVEEAISALGYRPNHAARLLRTNRSHRIGAIAHEMSQSGPASMIQGASRRAREAGYLLDIVSVEGFDETSFLDALDVLEQQQVAGILATAQTDSVRRMLLERATGVPIFVSDRMDTGDGVNHRVGMMAARFLTGLGHRRFLVIAGPEQWASAQERLDGFRSAVMEHRGAELAIDVGDWSAESGYRVGWRADLDAAGITAVFAQNDQMALGCIAALGERGIRVPSDVSVIGVDDIPEARYLTPALSTVWIDFEAEGRYAIDALVARIEGTAPPTADLLPRIELRARASAIAVAHD